MDSQDSKFARQRGSALLLVLLAVAILAMLYMIDIRSIFGPSLRVAPTGSEERPWLLEDLLAAEGDVIRLPKSPKPTLDSPIALAGSVRRDNDPRGTVHIVLNMDGRIRADWLTDYAHEQRMYHLEATATGNINVKQTFQNTDETDKSRLFFIAKGPYKLLTDDPQTGRSEENGTVWLLGYLRPDGRADGTLTLTTDQQWAAVYRFAAAKE